MSDLERERLVAELRRLSAMMHSSTAGAQAFMDIDLTIAQLRVVFLLSESEPMRMSPLAEELGITLPACTHLVDRLVDAGLVERSADPRDRRAVLCSLTDKGVTLVERFRQSNPFERQEFLDRLTVEELRTVVQAVGIIQRVLSEMEAERGAPDGE